MPQYDLLKNSLPAPEQLVVDGMEEGENGVVVRVRANLAPRCPGLQRIARLLSQSV